ncbi:protein SUPPRESSOR OF GENE SILENCING 3 homolog [Telopea speciosissima]|uniref:protein SUPPRESSOR OF GENE SILENCING 3 homolog n=1 Tax=Telopea speciosissima TaxID=54955 RepID=UPI001CC7115E|nr:protein SUPPRESSOR OF GENE SILENCING 3 homolog [Telopea speciosissima]
MTGSNPKGFSHKSSSSSSHRKSRWESGKNTNPDSNSGAAGDAKPLKPSLNSKDDSAAPGPSKLPLDPVPSSAPGHFPSGGGGAGASFPFPDQAGIGPPPPPAYGFHMLERRTIALADGSARSYFALPHDYLDFPPADRFLALGREPGSLGLGFDKHFPPGGLSPEGGFRRDGNEPFGRGGGQFDYWNSLGLDGRVPPEASLKRRYGDEDERDGREREEAARQRQQLLRYANPNANSTGFMSGSGDRADYLSGKGSPFRRDPLDSNRGGDDFNLRSSKLMRVGGDYGDIPSRHGVVEEGLKYPDVDPQALKKAFLGYTKLINENASERKNYLEDGKHGPLQCLACGRASKDFPDMHALIMHAFNSHNSDMRVDHLGLHKALCILMGWNHANPPENSKTYQSLSADGAAANKDDLIMWPPVVIIHNTNSGRGKDGRMEGMGNKSMDNKLRDLGFGGGKSKSLYGKDGHLGITLVKFAGDQSGLKEAIRLEEFFERDNHGRQGWARAQSSQLGKDDENNPYLVKVDEKTGEKKRIFYGYLGTAFDLDTIDFETRKRTVIESRSEWKPSN